MLFLKFKSAFRLLGTLSIAIALFSLSGGHWAVLQSVAWVRMIQGYSAQGSFQSAIEKTFSGNYRCSLCKKIDQAKHQDKKKCFVNESLNKQKGILEQTFSFLKFFPISFHFPKTRKDFYSGPVMRPLLEPPRIA